MLTLDTAHSPIHPISFRPPERGDSSLGALMVRRFVTTFSLLALTLAPFNHARAQTTDELVREPDDETRLRAWLDMREESEQSATEALGIAIIPIGAVLMAGGIVIMALPEMAGWTASETELSAVFAGLGGAIVGLSAMEIALGVAILSSDAWRRIEIPEGRLDEREIGRLEERLHTRARMARLGRHLSTATSTGFIAIGGAAAGGLAAVGSDLETYFGFYLLAGAMSLTGVVTLIMSLFESSAEADWREYQEGLMPRPRDEGLSIRMHGLGVAGTF